MSSSFDGQPNFMGLNETISKTCSWNRVDSLDEVWYACMYENEKPLCPRVRTEELIIEKVGALIFVLLLSPREWVLLPMD